MTARAREIYGSDIPWLLRALRCFAIQDSSYRFTWGEISFQFGLRLGYSVYHERASWCIHLIWPALYINAPMLITQRTGTEDWLATYGFSWFMRDIHFNWRTKCKIVHLPWAWEHVRHDVFDKDQKRRPWIAHWRLADNAPKDSDGRYIEKHPYKYTLRNGTVQQRTAEIFGDEMEWRWKWFTWLPWPRKIKRCIDVTFNDEVGEGTGSWKGGTIGCGWEWREGESMLDALRRMEAERKFT